MKRANQRARQGYPDFRLQTTNIDLGSEEEPKKKISHRAMSEAVIEGKGDKDDGDISLPMDINENSQSFLSETPVKKDVDGEPLQLNMDVEKEPHDEDVEGQIDQTDEDESIPQKASH